MTKQQFVKLAKPVRMSAECDGGMGCHVKLLKPQMKNGKVFYTQSVSLYVGLADGTTQECKAKITITPVGQDEWEPPVHTWSQDVADNYIAKFGSLPSGVVVK